MCRGLQEIITVVSHVSFLEQIGVPRRAIERDVGEQAVARILVIIDIVLIGGRGGQSCL
jgi:hypothetical protein